MRAAISSLIPVVRDPESLLRESAVCPNVVVPASPQPFTATAEMGDVARIGSD
jgi:hypothetical protein